MIQKVIVLKMLNIELPYDSAALLLAIYQVELKTHGLTKTCTQRFIALSFMMSKSENSPSIHQLKNG